MKTLSFERSRNKLLAWLLLIAMTLSCFLTPPTMVFGGSTTEEWEHNGEGLADLTSETGIVFTGQGVTKGQGFQKDYFFLAGSDIDDLKAAEDETAKNAKLSSLGLGNSWVTDRQFSAHEVHGNSPPTWIYSVVSGIDLKTAYEALGVDMDTAGTMALNVKATDGFSETIETIFSGTRYVYDIKGARGAVVEPIIAFYKDDVKTTIAPSDSSDLTIPTTASKASSSLFSFGQTGVDDHTGCSWVKYTDKVALGNEPAALTLTKDGNPSRLSIAELVRKGVYKISYSYYPNSATEETTHDLTGIPLTSLLESESIQVTSDSQIIAKASDNNYTKNIPYGDLSKWFVAYDAKEDGKIVENATHLRLYGPGQYGNSVLVKNVAELVITSSGGGDDGPGGGDGPGSGKKQPGGNVANAIFYIAVKDSESSEIKYYYYTKAELESYETTEDFYYNDHSVKKTVTAKGALLKDLLNDLVEVNITDDCVIQYAESDGYHADQDKAVEASNCKDKVKWLTTDHDKSGVTVQPARTVITYGINEKYDHPDAYNQNDPEGVFKDADNNSGYLRAYREIGSGKNDANIASAGDAVIKYLMGVVVSYDGKLFSGKDGYTLRTTSDKNAGLKIRDDSKVTGLVPGMQYAVKAPKVVNSSLSAGQPAYQQITVEKDSDALIEFKYTEGAYFSIKTDTATTNYVYTDMVKQSEQVPNASENTAPYGYNRPMYYRYNGMWLSDLVGNLGDTSTITKVFITAKDGKRTSIKIEDIDKYFVAYNNTESKTSTNIPEHKRVTKTYDSPKIIIPSEGENITGSSPTDYTTAGKDVGILVAEASSITITRKSTGGSGSGETTAPKPEPVKPVVTVNGVTLKTTTDANGTLIVTLNNGSVGKVDNDTVVLAISNSNDAQVNCSLPALGSSSLALTTSYGTLLIPNDVIQDLMKQYGENVVFAIKKGSFTLSLLSNGKEVSYRNSDTAFVISLPVTSNAGSDANAYVAVKKEAAGNVILPFAVVKDSKLNVKVSGTGTYDALYNQKSFTDTGDHWAQKSIAFVTAREIFTGMGEGRFQPNGTMTRAMFAQVLANLEKADLSAYTSSRFSDVPQGAWYQKAVEWAASNEIVNGTGDGEFSPNTAVSREQMATMLSNYIKYKGFTLKNDNKVTFADGAKISSWAASSVDTISKAGIISGKPGNLFDPRSKATRAEVATIMERLCTMVTETISDIPSVPSSGTGVTTPSGSSNSGSGGSSKTDAEPYSTVPAKGEYITVTQSGESKYFTVDDMTKAGLKTYTYSGRNKDNDNQRQFITVSGIRLDSLLDLTGWSYGDSIKITCADGYKKSYRLSEIMALMAFSGEEDDADTDEVPAIIALTDDGFRLMYGQADYDSDESKDFNMQGWARQVVKIELN